VAALVWLLIPLAAAVAAAIWGRWAARRRTTGDGASLAGYERFREAMQNPAASAGASGPVRTATEGAGSKAPPGGEDDSPRGPVAGPVP
jgi:hypothetical protein